MPAQTSPGSIRSAPVVAPSGRSGDKSATGGSSTIKRRKWTRQDAEEVITCCFLSDPTTRGYRKRMHTIWKQRNPHWNITEQRLLDQQRVISSTSILSDLELNELKQQLGIGGQSQDETDQSQNRTEQYRTALILHMQKKQLQPQQVQPVTIHAKHKLTQQSTINDSLLEEIRTEWINTTSNAQVRDPLWIDKWKMQLIRHLTAEANHAIHIIHTMNITGTNPLIYATAKVITRHTSTQKTVRTNTQNSTPPWRRRLENKIKKLRKGISRMERARKVKSRI